MLLNSKILSVKFTDLVHHIIHKTLPECYKLRSLICYVL